MAKKDNSELAELLLELGNSLEQKKKLKQEFNNVSIARNTTKQIVLPEGMDYDQAIMWLQRRKEEEETEVAINEEIDAYPLDGAYALAKVLQDIYGWANLIPERTWFGDKPPVMIGVEIAPGEIAQVAWGVMKIPGISGHIQTNFTVKEGRPIFVLAGVVKRKHEKPIHDLANEVRKALKTCSIYKGKAIRINYRNADGERTQFSVQQNPKFMNLSKINEAELIFPKTTAELVEVNLFTPVEKTLHVRKQGIPLKRGVMLEGPYGTGKTLTAGVLAKKCMANGWTFIYLEDVRDLDMAIHFARQYEPAVVFAEDLDRAVGETRTDDANRIINTLDGVATKDNEIIVVLTTNEVMKIHKSMVRPGRIDAVISVRQPDEEAVMKLIRLYGRGLVEATDDDLRDAVQPLLGNNAAVIRESVERAKLSSCRHLANENDPLKIFAGDIFAAANSMKAHLDLLREEKPAEVSGSEKFKDEIAEKVAQHLGNGKNVVRTAPSPKS